MFGDLRDVWSLDESDLVAPFVIVSDSIKADGAFVLHHFLQLFLKAGRDVCLVAFDQPVGHYVSVARKLGVASAAAAAADPDIAGRATTSTTGRLTFIDGFSDLFGWAAAAAAETARLVPPQLLLDAATDGAAARGPTDSARSPAAAAAPAAAATTTTGGGGGGAARFTVRRGESGGEASVRSLYGLVRDCAARGGSSCCLLIDSLGPLLTAVGPLAVADFVRYCRALMKGSNGALLVLVHDADATAAAAPGAHAADIALRIEPLESGYAPDVDGQLVAAFANGLLGQSERKWRFRLTETGCKFL